MTEKKRGSNKSSDKSGSNGKTEKSNGFVRNEPKPVIDHHPPPNSKPQKKK